MINSISHQLHEIQIPDFTGKVSMLPFDLETLNEIPLEFNSMVTNMIKFLPMKKGIAYLTVDGKLVKEGLTHRRGGMHIDGNYIHDISSWGVVVV